ncbi:MAG: hypothetical protein U9Q69_01710 [Nanoarchaeota archaeon]|nr:hypothetical protein [Nanoarchaeota archaeon]
MKLGLDIDDVCLKTRESILDYLNFRFKLNIQLKSWNKTFLADAFKLPKEPIKRFFQEYKESDFFHNLEPLPFFREIANTMPHDKYFITMREKDLQEETEEQFERLLISFDSEKLFLVGEGTETALREPIRKKRKAMLAKELGLDLFIEDDAEIALELANQGIPVLLFNYPWNQNTNAKGVIRIGDWKSYDFWRLAEKCFY